jgi:hypothetical protein
VAKVKTGRTQTEAHLRELGQARVGSERLRQLLCAFSADRVGVEAVGVLAANTGKMAR